MFPLTSLSRKWMRGSGTRANPAEECGRGRLRSIGPRTVMHFCARAPFAHLFVGVLIVAGATSANAHHGESERRGLGAERFASQRSRSIVAACVPAEAPALAGGGPVIALIDTGVEASHPDLAGALVAGFDFVNNDADADDVVGHGTELAGVIAANGVVQGVCPLCRVMPLKVAEYYLFDPAPQTDAVMYAINAGVDVICFGAGAIASDPALADAIALADSLGIVVVAPAGSEELTQTLYPAALPGVVSVAASDVGGGFLASASTSGFETTAAPGAETECAALGGGTITRLGSSISAARVAGVAGLALLANPSLTPAQVRQVLRYGSVPSGLDGWTERFGYGVTDAALAVQRAAGGFGDCAIARLTILPTNPQSGQANVARVRVLNAGNQPTGALTLSVTHDLSQNPIVAPVASLALGEFVDVDVVLPAGVGGQTANLQAEVSAATGEGDASNNIRGALIEYDDAPLHDVGLDVGAISEPVSDAGAIMIPVRVQNYGNQSEALVDLRLLDDAGATLDAVAFSLGVGAAHEVVLTMPLPAETSESLHHLKFVALLSSPDDDPADNTAWLDIQSGPRLGLAKLQYSDRGGTEIVIDAPWRTVRNYLPVLFFAPRLGGSDRRIDELVVHPYGLGAGAPDRTTVIARDRRRGADTLPGITIINPLGGVGADLTDGETFKDFWHYVMRIPRGRLGDPAAAGQPLYLFGEATWSRVRIVKKKGRDVEEAMETHTHSRVLRVFVDAAAFPKFDAADRYYDVHVHTIAEQTNRAWGNSDAARKNFGGPLVMLLEASHALGLLDTQQDNGNWDAFKDKLVATDHNVFYSQETSIFRQVFGGPRSEDSPSAPAYGPTAGTNGHTGERDWYRTHFGKLAGEEVALSRGSAQRAAPGRNNGNFIGHHFLVYAANHVEGPWHGGLFLGALLENSNSMVAVLNAMKALGAPAGGFGYAAHPDAGIFTWPPEYFCQALGWAANGDGDVCAADQNAFDGPHVNRAGDDFTFKGSQVWNARNDEVAARNGAINSNLFNDLNPFAGGHANLRFRADMNWDAELNTSLQRYFGQVRRGLVYNLRNPADANVAKRKFSRKIYVAAGTDAHGDFNYSDDVESTATAQARNVGSVTSNAYARVRTYTLAHERPAVTDQTPGQDPDVDNGEERSHDAYRDGNTVLTDGPILTFSLDSDGRHNTSPGANPRWHDAASDWEFADGRIGGRGKFDGGLTMLVPGPGDNVWISSTWKGSPTPGAGGLQHFDIFGIRAGAADIAEGCDCAGEEGVARKGPFPYPFDRPAAYLLQSPDFGSGERCITNPVWAMPVTIEIAHAGVCPIPAGGLTVTMHFPISMSGSGGVFVRPLDGAGNSVNPEVALQAAPGWEEENGVFNGKYTAKNTDNAIACPPGGWDAESHAASAERFSYVVYMVAPADVNQNVLNDIGRTFVVVAAPPEDCLRGDSNCDGVVDNGDIDCFVTALVGGEAAWQACALASNPACEYDYTCVHDLNGDTAVDNGDIAGFVDCLLNLPAMGEGCP